MTSKRKKNALVLGACALALYLLQMGWFLLFGPPEWFEAVGQRKPEITSIALGSAFDPYLDEFAAPGNASFDARGPDLPAERVGRIVREDHVNLAGPVLLQTIDEEGAGHLYARRDEADRWRELRLPPRGKPGEARWLRDGGGFGIVLAVSRSWWPLGRSYGRFWRALVTPELRPTNGLYLLDPLGEPPVYLFAGRSPLPSPDRTAVAFLRSERRGFHSLHLWRAGMEKPVTVVSLWEAEPGSGPSFHWSWSSDSRVLFVRGRARGSSGSPARGPRPLRLLYDVAGDRLVDLR